MKQGIVRIALLGTLYASSAVAAGLGEMVLHSRLGEPMYAEIPLDGGSELDTACFSIVPAADRDLPGVADARLRLIRDGERRRLVVTSLRPVNEPLFAIGLRVQCGVDLRRDYTLMPNAPEQAIRPAAPLALPSAPSLPASTVAATTAANPALTVDTPKPAKTRTPRPKPKTAPKSEGSGDSAANASPAASATPPAAPPAALPPVAAAPAPAAATPAPSAAAPNNPPPATPKAAPPRPAAGDRLVLGSGSEEPTARPNDGQSKGAPRNSAELSARIQQLEATIQSMNQEIEQTNRIIELANQALQLQQQAQTRQAALAAQPPAPPERAPERWQAWLELLLAALAGGGIVALLTRRLGRPRQTDWPAPPVAAAAPPVQVTPPAAAAPDVPNTTAAPAPAPAAPKASAQPAPKPEIESRTDYSDSDSAMALAEIMLSFGRLQGAADTLNDYIQTHAPSQPQPWLMLLDLYRRGAMHDQYVRLAAEIQKRFNIRIADQDTAATVTSGLKSLESYAHIVEHLTERWGTPAALDYLRQLISDNREGARQGFPLEIVEEIALLMHILEDGHGLKQAA